MDPIIFHSRIGLVDMVKTLSRAIDLISPRLRNHHFQVAYITSRLCGQIGIKGQDARVGLISALVHDIGGLSAKDVQDRLTFDDEAGDISTHAYVGAELLSSLDLFVEVAPVVRFHHELWAYGEGASHNGVPVPQLSHVLHCGFRFDPATHSDLIPAIYSNSIPAIHSDMDPATYSDRIPATP